MKLALGADCCFYLEDGIRRRAVSFFSQIFFSAKRSREGQSAKLRWRVARAGTGKRKISSLFLFCLLPLTHPFSYFPLVCIICTFPIARNGSEENRRTARRLDGMALHRNLFHRYLSIHLAWVGHRPCRHAGLRRLFLRNLS